jgi:hypothetical protein
MHLLDDGFAGACRFALSVHSAGVSDGLALPM